MKDPGFSWRWDIPLMEAYRTPIPNFMFDVYHLIGVTRNEFLLILHLARYHYEYKSSVSCPSIKTVAKQMGYSRRSVQALLSSMEKKGMLVRTPRLGTSTIYGFKGFAEKAIAAAHNLGLL